MSKFFGQRLTRRQALEGLGIGAAAAALPRSVFAQAPAFPKGAIIRTILKDYAPEELAGGATLFHEHFQLGPDFNAKFQAASAAVRAANGLPPAPARGGVAAKGGNAPPPRHHARRRPDVAEVKAASEGNIACIVEAGHAEMGRDINFIRQWP
jgi:predicted metal-dependent phosphotriesterase family hydrolase